jgi:hypothetical protein
VTCCIAGLAGGGGSAGGALCTGRTGFRLVGSACGVACILFGGALVAGFIVVLVEACTCCCCCCCWARACKRVVTPSCAVFCGVWRMFSTLPLLLVLLCDGLGLERVTLDSELGDKEVSGLWNG